jgi:hypothetical protein
VGGDVTLVEYAINSPGHDAIKLTFRSDLSSVSALALLALSTDKTSFAGRSVAAGFTKLAPLPAITLVTLLSALSI